jgi:hypothetical protein
MRKIVLAVGVVSLMAGTATAAERLTDQRMDMVTAGGIPIIAVPGTPINNPGCGAACDIVVAHPVLPAGIFDIAVAAPVLPPGIFDIVVEAPVLPPGIFDIVVPRP